MGQFWPLFWSGNPLHPTRTVTPHYPYVVSIYHPGTVVAYEECGYAWGFSDYHLVCVIYICVLEHDMYMNHAHFIKERDHNHWLFAFQTAGRVFAPTGCFVAWSKDHRQAKSSHTPSFVQQSVTLAFTLHIHTNNLNHELRATGLMCTRSAGCFLTHIV